MERKYIPIKWPSLIAYFMFACISLSASGQAFHIGYTRTVLSSGMTVVIHESRDIPRVAIDVTFDVGSSSETDTEHGLAHLCEHLYFERGGDPKGFISSMENLGGTDIDGTTDSDHTEFFETIPARAVGAALALEKKRMYGHLSESNFRKQVEIVEQELSHDSDDPEHYALAQIEDNAYPPNHPYSHFPLGTTSSVSSLSLAQADKWMRQYFVPCNATLTIVGDIKPEIVMQYAKRLFAAPTCISSDTRNSAWSSPRYGDRTIDSTSPNSAPRILMEWNIPGYSTPTLQYLKLAVTIIRARFSARADTMETTKSEHNASLFSEIDEGRLGSMLTLVISGTTANQQNAAQARVLAIISSLAKDGPTARELRAAKADFELATFRKADSFESLAHQMALGQVLIGSPDALAKAYERTLSCTAPQLRTAVDAWLTTGLLSVDVHPDEMANAVGLPPRYALLHSRAPSRMVSSIAGAITFTSAIGASVMLIRRSDTPLTSIAFVFHTGFTSEPRDQRGITSLAMHYISQNLSRKFWTMAIPATVNATVLPDISVLSIETTKSYYYDVADISLSTISSEHISREQLVMLKSAQMRQVDREQLRLPQAAESFIPMLLFKQGSSCRTSWTGNGINSDIHHITADQINRELVKLTLHSGLTVAVVGDVNRSQVAVPFKVVSKRTGLYVRPSRRTAGSPLFCSAVNSNNGQELSLMYSPHLSNSMIAAGLVLPGLADKRFDALRLWSNALGGGLYSSLNRVLREQKGWSYGVRTFLIPSRKLTLMLIVAYVRNNEVVPALVEIEGELASAAKGHVIASDLAAARRDEQEQVINHYATTGSLQAALDADIEAETPFSSIEREEAVISSISESRVSTTLTSSLDIKKIKWLVISGDSSVRGKVEATPLFVVHSSTAIR